jgi:hypothetical protein
MRPEVSIFLVLEDDHLYMNSRLNAYTLLLESRENRRSPRIRGLRCATKVVSDNVFVDNEREAFRSDSIRGVHDQPQCLG